MKVKVIRFLLGIKRYLLCLVLAAFFSLLISLLLLNAAYQPGSSFLGEKYKTTTTTTATSVLVETATKYPIKNDLVYVGNLFSNSELRTKLLKEKIERLSKRIKKSRSIIVNSKTEGATKPNYNVHIFYYAWYGNQQYDGVYKHWNHSYLSNWKNEDRRVYPTGMHSPPVDIASNYYPLLGCYSSNDPNVINTHMRQLRDNGIGVLILSWNPPGFPDSISAGTIATLFDTAAKYRLKIALHVEPYLGRNPINLLEHLKKFFARYINHPGLFKMRRPLGRVDVPVVYIYDSYLTPAVAWRELLSNKGNLSVRNTQFDAIFMGLLVDLQHRYHIKKSQFDGLYTYFSSNSFTYGSTWKNWRSLARFATQNGLVFVPCVGPGYADTRVRPWNGAVTRHRRHGQYYDVAWRAAIGSGARYVAVTSYNEWHEGTQIEAAREIAAGGGEIEKSPEISERKNRGGIGERNSNGGNGDKTDEGVGERNNGEKGRKDKESAFEGYTYLDYRPENPDYYLNLTRWWIDQFEKSLN